MLRNLFAWNPRDVTIPGRNLTALSSAEASRNGAIQMVPIDRQELALARPVTQPPLDTRAGFVFMTLSATAVMIGASMIVTGESTGNKQLTNVGGVFAAVGLIGGLVCFTCSEASAQDLSPRSRALRDLPYF